MRVSDVAESCLGARRSEIVTELPQQPRQELTHRLPVRRQLY
jgi:hypothetical protein